MSDMVKQLDKIVKILDTLTPAELAIIIDKTKISPEQHAALYAFLEQYLTEKDKSNDPDQKPVWR